MKNVFITSIGKFLPNSPISNEEMEEYLGKINGDASRVRERILNQNGIQSRHYALDKEQKTTHLNSNLATKAIEEALSRRGINGTEIDFLATGTTQGDLPIPGFASMVHAESDLGPCEIANFQSVCASGVMALKMHFFKFNQQRLIKQFQ